jgi:hypothetical protein
LHTQQTKRCDTHTATHKPSQIKHVKNRKSNNAQKLHCGCDKKTQTAHTPHIHLAAKTNYMPHCITYTSCTTASHGTNHATNNFCAHETTSEIDTSSTSQQIGPTNRTHALAREAKTPKPETAQHQWFHRTTNKLPCKK